MKKRPASDPGRLQIVNVPFDLLREQFCRSYSNGSLSQACATSQTTPDPLGSLTLRTRYSSSRNVRTAIRTSTTTKVLLDSPDGQRTQLDRDKSLNLLFSPLINVFVECGSLRGLDLLNLSIPHRKSSQRILRLKHPGIPNPLPANASPKSDRSICRIPQATHQSSTPLWPGAGKLGPQCLSPVRC